MDKIPAYFKDKEPPIISYQYTNTVANKLFNLSSTLSNLDITNYLSNPQHCQCNTSKFCYEPHGHVITGDLMVIENVKLTLFWTGSGRTLYWGSGGAKKPPPG